MAPIKRYMTAGGTLVCVLGIAYFMQAGAGAGLSLVAVQSVNAAPERATEITRIELTSAPAVPAARPPAPAALPPVPATRVVARDMPVPVDALPVEEGAPSFSCDVEMSATVLDHAMVRLDIEAPCSPNARFTLHHNGLMASAMTDGQGHGLVNVPALAEAAVFIAAFQDGVGAVATARVPDVADIDRYVVQWNGDAASLHLHALEYGADFGQPGHVWGGAAATEAEGTLVRLGDGVPAPAFHAEIYTFPTRAAAREGSVTLRLEAEVTAANCGRNLEAQGIATSLNGALNVQDVVLPMPDCAAQGEFLVLKDLFNDLKIAQK